jgi:Xaa-Pro aminopeptidase
MASVPIEEYRSRVAKARALMAERGMDGLVITDAVNFYYFSGQRVPAWMKARPAVFILPLEGEPAIINWSGPAMFARVYNRPYPSWVEDKRLYPEIPFDTEERTDWGIRAILEDRKLTDGVLGIELGKETWLGIPYKDFQRLQEELPNVRWVESGPVTWPCRIIKSEWEIATSRKACEIGGKAWKRLFEELRIGISTREILERNQRYAVEGGADLGSDIPMAHGATGPDGTFQKGDVLYLDGGCSYLGYRMDFTRRAVFGKPNERQLAEHDGMWELMFRVMDRMKPGVRNCDVFAYSQAELAKTGWRNYSDHPAKRICHGIGLETEPPSMNAFETMELQEGMVLTPEPKIESVDGLVNPEEQVVIRRDGCEILSPVPDWHLFVVD